MPIPAGEFKAKCLSLMDLVEERQEEIVVTKYGRPVAKLVPYTEKRPDVFGWMKDTVRFHGTPDDTKDRWNAGE